MISISLIQDWNKNEFNELENEQTHRPLEDEYSFYNAVKAGNMEFVQKNIKENEFGRQEGMGVLSKNPLSNIRYHFVITTAMLTRHCIEGGMELERAYRLSDFYILKMDSCQSIQEIVHLHNTMALDFTGKMLLLQKTAVLSKPITLCIDYIYKHIHSRLTIEELADYANLSASYLSRLFKKELGISVSDYIREKKVEHAQNLLKYSNYTLIEIANYLSFSSESHFIQVFEKMTGKTPKKYRDSYYRTSW